MHLCHLSSVHPRRDTRILHKECVSLVRAGHQVTLVVADSLPDETVGGVAIRSVPKASGRLARMAFAPWRVFRAARRLKAECYHLHDPELIPVGLLLRLLGAKVIYDAHEDLPKQIMAKPYLPRWVRRPLAALLEGGLRLALPRFSALVAATPSIRERLSGMNHRVVEVKNFPILGELGGAEGPDAMGPRRSVCYVGGITRVRGVAEMVEAAARFPAGVELVLAGPFGTPEFQRELEASPGWTRTRYLGVLDRKAVAALFRESFAGLVTLHPTPNHLEAYPVKLFEYMSAGLPVIASHFPVWNALLGNGAYGLSVDPMDPQAIAAVVGRLWEDKVLAQTMGAAGRCAVEASYCWEVEAQVLADLVHQVASPKPEVSHA